MAKVVVKKQTKKTKKKFPIQIQAPEYLNSVVLGESQVTDTNQMYGRTSQINLMYVTGNVKNQNVRLTFKITEVNSGVAYTEVSRYEQIPYYLGRFVKKGGDLVEDSFVVETKDGESVRIKPFIVTKDATSNLVLSSVRKQLYELVGQEAAENKGSDFMASVINGRIQNMLRGELKKIFPLKACEFRKVEFS